MSLQHIQEELNAPKDKYNKFSEFKYRSAEGILEALKPLLAKYQYSLVISDTLELIGDRYYVKATASLYDDKMSLITHASAYAREELALKKQQASQITGGTSSYARKYCLNGLFLIDDSPDADSMDNTQNHLATQEQVLQIQALITETQTELPEFLKYFRVNAISDLTSANAVNAINTLNKKKAKQ